MTTKFWTGLKCRGRGMGLIATVLASVTLPTSCAVVTDEEAPRAPLAQRGVTPGLTPVAKASYGYAESIPLGRTAEAPRKPAPAKVRMTSYLGSAPYICSASGFGQKSRCFTR
ncbi:hypothetical protein [Ciceribacter azotifigens]|uniref:hypothetical protein n=1 Tax=Ciceribacter azotifigens TaxID=2069303 RepID=UPI003A8B8339